MNTTSVTYSVLLFLLCGCAGAPQYTATGEQIPPRTNVIYIVTDDSPEEGFRKIGRLLQTSGFGINSSDETLGSITSTVRTLSQGFTGMIEPVEMQIFATVMSESPTRIQLRGQWSLAGENDYTNISLLGQENSPYRRAWDEMYEVAEGYEGASLEFDRQ